MDGAKTLYLIRGVPGSGKSTLAEMICAATDAAHCEADMFFQWGGEYQFRVELLPKAHKWCQDLARHYMKSGANVVVANTFTRQWELKPYREMAQEYGYHIQEVICQGRFANTHGVSPEKVAEMAQRFEF